MINPYYDHDDISLFHGDCREVIPQLTDPIATVITDPPYGLNFMGKDWDHGLPGEAFWQIIKDAVLPGCLLLSFGGTRTFHRLTCAIEDAGWEIRDCLMWLYGSGFPKSLDVSKAIDKAKGERREQIARVRVDGKKPGKVITGFGNGDPRLSSLPASDLARLWSGYGTALKPAWEPIILAMKPLDGTFAANAEKHGVAGLWIDGSQIETDWNTDPGMKRTGYTDGINHQPKYNNVSTFGGDQTGKEIGGYNNKGRFPANLILDEAAGAMVDGQSGNTKSTAGNRGPSYSSPNCNEGWKRKAHEKYIGMHNGFIDSGGASRFFYCAKASRAERGENNGHPTVKPLSLMRYLCLLTKTPTGGLILDPFAGSGSTLIAARMEGRPAIGIEKEEQYCEIAARRLEADKQTYMKFDHLEYAEARA